MLWYLLNKPAQLGLVNLHTTNAIIGFMAPCATGLYSVLSVGVVSAHVQWMGVVWAEFSTLKHCMTMVCVLHAMSC